MDKIILADYDEVSMYGAVLLAEQIRQKPHTVLGLATGSTPVGMYMKLVDMHKRSGLDFSSVRTFNLDEYYPIKKSSDQSYDYFMWNNLFSHINIKGQNVHIPNGECEDPSEECAAYERAIADVGRIDIQVLGIGVEGHIGFNEAEEELQLDTHLTGLSPSTIEANARFFAKASDVPDRALTMGVGTIMRARAILLLITGENKATVAKKLLSGGITTKLPASMLHMHDNVTVLLDEAAASLL